MRRVTFPIFVGTVVVLVWAIVVLVSVVRDQYTPDAALSGLVTLVIGGYAGAEWRRRKEESP